MKKLILASESPYKRQLFERLALPYTVCAPRIDESPLASEKADALVQRLAKSKAAKIADAEKVRDSIIISSDQVASVENAILGKPGNHHNAAQQLKLLSGQYVTFYTGLCVIDTDSKQTWQDCVAFHVQVRKLTDAQIERYLHQEKPYDCAGSFKAEGYGITLFESMQGNDPTSLLGLPLIRLTTFLNAAGIPIP